MRNPEERETGWVPVGWRRAAQDGKVVGAKKVHRWAEKNILDAPLFPHTLPYTPLPSALRL